MDELGKNPTIFSRFSVFWGFQTKKAIKKEHFQILFVKIKIIGI
jgi:hypothetical protein